MADPLSALSRPWSGTLFLHAPPGVADGRFPLDELAKSKPDARWSDPQQPTLYLAADPAIALTEFARHLALDGEDVDEKRDLLRLEVRLSSAVDLRDPPTLAVLGISDAPFCFIDRRIARRTADRVRAESRATAVMTPPMAFLDQPDRFDLVLFVEKLPAQEQWLHSFANAGELEVRSSDDGRRSS